jgi:hypothetical protein
MNTSFDPTKPVRCRDGKPARIICTDRKGPHAPIVALVTFGDEKEIIRSYTAKGAYYSEGTEHPNDLVNISRTCKVWGIVFEFGEHKLLHASAYHTEEHRDEAFKLYENGKLNYRAITKFETEVEVP